MLLILSNPHVNCLNHVPKYSKMQGKNLHTIYTDGSKTKDGVGSGFTVYYRNKRIHTDFFTLPKEATVFLAEIEAIYSATQFLLADSYEHDKKSIKIYSISQAAIKALHNERITSKSVLKALESMESATYRTKITSLN